ncbi:MAG: alpha/beta hydrolase [Actinomycetota bacterium]|nr:alpha/beta hydrolase [Actinomycetota bacterium]
MMDRMGQKRSWRTKSKKRNSLLRAFSIVLAVSLFTLFFPFLQGCISVRGYSILENDEVIGSERFWKEEHDDFVIYKSTTRRPFLDFETTLEQEVKISKNGYLLAYYGGHDRGGPIFSASLDRTDIGRYNYFRDDLQTFEDVSGFDPGMNFFPLERGSVCSLQILLDRLLESHCKELRLVTMIPSQGKSLYETFATMTKNRTVAVVSSGINYLLKFDGNGEIVEVRDRCTGLVFKKGWPGRPASKPYPLRARRILDVRITSIDGIELAGSLLIPRGKPPYKAVVLVGDEGPQDRTGCGFLSQLANRLAKEGFAVLSCDRRGVADSEGNYRYYTLETEVQDIHSKIDYLVMRGDIDIERIGIVGYGEGGISASAAASSNPYIQACVLIATPSAPYFPDTFLRMLDEERKTENLGKEEFESKWEWVNYLVSLVESSVDKITIGKHKPFLGWMRSHMEHDTLQTLELLEVPVLVVAGASDRIVPVEEARELMEALEKRKGFESKIITFDGLDHWFGNMIDEAGSKPYMSHPKVETNVLDEVSRWLVNGVRSCNNTFLRLPCV